jgi:hypothetical protein
VDAVSVAGGAGGGVEVVSDASSLSRSAWLKPATGGWVSVSSAMGVTPRETRGVYRTVARVVTPY